MRLGVKRSKKKGGETGSFCLSSVHDVALHEHLDVVVVGLMHYDTIDPVVVSDVIEQKECALIVLIPRKIHAGTINDVILIPLRIVGPCLYATLDVGKVVRVKGQKISVPKYHATHDGVDATS